MMLLLGTISIDSGQVLIVDPAYLSEWMHGDFDLANAEEGDAVPFLNNYDEVCRVTYKKGYGQVLSNSAVASMTMWGDGVYNVYGDMDENTGRPKRIIIELDEDNPVEILDNERNGAYA